MSVTLLVSECFFRVLDVFASSVVVAAVGLAEEVLAVRDDTLRVQDVPNFASLVHKFSSHQLASFCRVLAMVVFEPEVELCQFISSLQIESCVLSCQML